MKKIKKIKQSLAEENDYMNTSQWITIFQLLALISGIKELWAAREYYK